MPSLVGSEMCIRDRGFLPYRPVIPAIIKELSADGAAIRQGMKVSDRIVAINNIPMKDWFDVVDVVQKSPEKLLNIDVLRQGQVVHLQVMPQGQRDNMGNTTGMLGVKSDVGKITIPDEYKQTIQYSPIEALGAVSYTHLTLPTNREV